MPFPATTFNETGPRISPNGKWLAYVSDQAGEARVFVQAFPEGGELLPVSTGLGTEVVWSRDGTELFYRDGEAMWAVDVETEGAFAAGTPTLLFEAPYAPDVNNLSRYANYDVSFDGQFLMVQDSATSTAPGFVVVEHWIEELTRLVPTN